MKNYLQPGKTLTVASPGTITSGQLLVVGSIVGIANYDATVSDPLEIDIEGVFAVPKVSGDAIVAGDKLYWNGTALTKTPATGSKPLVGYATEAAGAGVTVVYCNLLPTLQTGPA